MKPRQLLDGLDLNDHLLLDQQIEPRSFLEADSIELEWDSLLPFHVEPAPFQLYHKELLVGRLQQTRPDVAVDVHSRIQDLTGDLI